MFYNADMNLKNLRNQRGLSQAQLGELAGVDQSVISKLERGWDGATLRNLKIISEALGVEVSDILVGERADSEQVLLNAFRSLSDGRQQGWIDMALQIIQDAPQDDSLSP